MNMAGPLLPPVRGRVDADGRLIEAEQRLHDLNARAGGSIGAPIAVPSIATIARLARHIDCPIHGIHVVRYPGDRFQLRVTEALEAPRDENGKIDVERTMQAITDVVEGWVREHPDQWLWVHRRWRN